MTKLVLALGLLTAALASTQAHAAIPQLNLTCGPGNAVHADEGGPVYIDGEESSLTVFNDNAYDAKLGETTISITINTDGKASGSYTGANRANGICNPAPGSTQAASTTAKIPFFNADVPATSRSMPMRAGQSISTARKRTTPPLARPISRPSWSRPRYR